MNCPVCNTAVDINCSKSTHQVNDNTEETYCSYECSAVATLMYLRDVDSPLSRDELLDIIAGT